MKTAVISLVAILALAVAAILITGPRWIGRAPRYAMIYVRPGATPAALHDSLARNISPEYADKVTRCMELFGSQSDIHPGAYAIPQGLQAFRAARRLASGRQTPVKIKINGFRNVDDLISRVSSKFSFTPQELRNVLYDPVRLDSAGHTRERAQVIFLDANYDFYWTDSASDIIGKFEKRYADFWTPERRTKAASLGLTPDETAVIASIVDEETTRSEEKSRIGRLYVNRLQKGMRLQADPTVRFALGDFTIKRVLRKHLFTQSPYNTYRFAGLPPGPIRTTSRATIDAILDSKPSDDLYMCARDDLSGTHVFSSDFESHKAAAEKYRGAITEIGL